MVAAGRESREGVGHVTGIVVVASNKEIGKHALKCQLLQQEISLPLATKQLVDQQSRLDEVINPVHASGGVADTSQSSRLILEMSLGPVVRKLFNSRVAETI